MDNEQNMEVGLDQLEIPYVIQMWLLGAVTLFIFSLLMFLYSTLSSDSWSASVILITLTFIILPYSIGLAVIDMKNRI